MTGAKTLAKERALGADLDGLPHAEPWEHASVIGSLMFLVNTRSDIQFAMHQCARFTHNPKQSHTNAVKRIICCLKGTELEGGGDRALTFVVGGAQDIPFIEAMCNSDFAGLWNVENNLDPVSSKSRTGFVIFVGGCPVVWQSKLQGETALSTMDAEIVALSQCM